MRRSRIGEPIASGIVLLLFAATFCLSFPAVAQNSCIGDCDGNGHCSVAELVTIVNVALDVLPVSVCEAGDADGDEQITIGEAVLGVDNALAGCPPLSLLVTKIEDTNDGACDDDCSLREAIIAANTHPRPATVIVPAGTYALALIGDKEDAAATGDLDITGELMLDGAGAEMTVIDGNATDRVFHIHGTASISGVTIQNGLPPAEGFYKVSWGGGILNFGTLRVSNSTLSGNSAEHQGGAIVNVGTLTLTDSTVSGNSAGGIGGGIANLGGSAELTNSTVSGNSADHRGGGIENDGTVTMTNSTLTGNSADFGGGIYNLHTSTHEVNLTNTIIANNIGGDNCSDYPVTSTGHNLDDDGSCGLTGEGDLSNIDAHLAPLGDYGGPTDTHVLCTGLRVPDASCMAASPALDAGDNASCPDTDQRGVERPQPIGGVCDIGAYEAE